MWCQYNAFGFQRHIYTYIKLVFKLFIVSIYVYNIVYVPNIALYTRASTCHTINFNFFAKTCQNFLYAFFLSALAATDAFSTTV